MTVKENICGFIAIINFPHPIKSYKKVHRLVVLPDYQGLGLGKILLNEVAKTYKEPFAITTSQPTLIAALQKDKDNWIFSRNSRNRRNGGNGSTIQKLNGKVSLKRRTCTFVYKKCIS